MSKILWTLCFAILFAAASWQARADEQNKLTNVTFSAPVEIPGNKVLPAGTYQFRLLNSTSNRSIVQIFNADGTQLIATLLTVPDFRRNPTSETVIRFAERPSGSPEALKAWFYPGDTYGNQFVYPQTEAGQIAKRTHENVLATRDEMKDDMAAPAKTGHEASVQHLNNAEVHATTPSGDQVDMSQAATPKKQQQ